MGGCGVVDFVVVVVVGMGGGVVDEVVGLMMSRCSIGSVGVGRSWRGSGVVVLVGVGLGWS